MIHSRKNILIILVMSCVLAFALLIFCIFFDVTINDHIIQGQTELQGDRVFYIILMVLAHFNLGLSITQIVLSSIIANNKFVMNEKMFKMLFITCMFSITSFPLGLVNFITGFSLRRDVKLVQINNQ
ncbi:hypothetical protein [[Acholeplasma] multilocale]|uniref:hypothetical protein n=1 Tax=[Acholeplasma] multilocale TaxID=264638 RepID=UPI00047A7DF8|nr:hypothetical protein [[Acholeplasma] multilocale]